MGTEIYHMLPYTEECNWTDKSQHKVTDRKSIRSCGFLFIFLTTYLIFKRRPVMKSYQNCIKFHILNYTKNNQVEKCTVYSKCTCSAYRIRNHRSKTGQKIWNPTPPEKTPDIVLFRFPGKRNVDYIYSFGKTTRGPVFPSSYRKKFYIRSVKENCN